MESTFSWNLRVQTRLLLIAAAVCAGSFFFISQANAAVYYWVGSDGRWETADNWSSIEKGGIGGSHAVPGADDTAVLSYSGAALTFRSAVSLTNLLIAPTWSGSVTMGSGTLTVSGNVRMGSGRILGGTGAVAITGTFTQTGGIVYFPGGRTGGSVTIGGLITITKGASSSYATFSSTGTLTLNGAANQSLTTGADTTIHLHNLTVNKSGGDGSDAVSIAT
ncbi:MAG: hypothetical protein AAB728_01660, partial [Patescibacteria group bacterium]